MKLSRKKRNLIYIAVAVVMIVVVVVVVMSRDGSTIEQNYNIKDTNTITKVIIDDKDERTLTLEKQSDSTWTVNGRAANYKIVESLLSTLKDMRVREPIAHAARNNIIKQLAASGKKVQVYQEKYFIDWGFVNLLFIVLCGLLCKTIQERKTDKDLLCRFGNSRQHGNIHDAQRRKRTLHCVYPKFQRLSLNSIFFHGRFVAFSCSIQI